MGRFVLVVFFFSFFLSDKEGIGGKQVCFCVSFVVCVDVCVCAHVFMYVGMTVSRMCLRLCMHMCECEIRHHKCSLVKFLIVLTQALKILLHPEAPWFSRIQNACNTEELTNIPVVHLHTHVLLYCILVYSCTSLKGLATVQKCDVVNTLVFR